MDSLFGSDSKKDREMEAAAFSHFAYDPYPAVHQLNQSSRNRKSQTGPAVGTGGRTLRLGEGVEDIPLLLGSDANTRVPHHEMQHHSFRGLRFEIHIHQHLSFISKLERVSNQVDQYLADPAQVSDQAVGHLSLHFVNQLKVPLVGPDRQGLQGVSNRVPQSEFVGIEFQLACLDLREIEDVIDDGEQRFGRVIDEIDVFPLLPLQVGGEQQFRHSHDAVHGRADLVTHVCQELALGAVGLFRCLLGLRQHRGRLFLRGDIAGEPEHADDLSRVVP